MTRVFLDDTETLARVIKRKADEPVRFSRILFEAHPFKTQPALFDPDDIVVRNVLTPTVVWSDLFGEPISKLGRWESAFIGRALTHLANYGFGWYKYGRCRSVFIAQQVATVYLREGKSHRKEFCSLDYDATCAELLGDEVQIGRPGYLITGNDPDGIPLPRQRVELY